MKTGPVGRPPVSGLTEALLSEAERIMAQEGYSALTIDALVTAVGTTRPTFYRRFPNIAHVALTVVKEAFGTDTLVDTGSLREDLLVLQREEVEMFSSPLLRNSLGGLLEAARADHDLLGLYEAEFIGPRRANVARVLETASARGEITGDIDAPFICDLLFGPILARTLMPIGAAVDIDLAERTTDAALAAMGVSAS